MTHLLGWEDGRAASVQRCDGEALGAQEWIASADEANQCPRCKKWLRLRWDVELVEELAPDERVRLAREALGRALVDRAAIDAERGVYRCAVCRENPVDVDAGVDTCDVCLRSA